ncbi:hypothetical protein PLICRDRAFT_440474 [Plicaturopsis crispa FD-325 SS-3]|uniref:Uncharacterized protein n=1 Tax=Plicaturopsis crispa FD-325 SS-3 TaxID=944288 RepID=A0A0C9T6R1_PLICR|nr:hypothetical protein PLICRDRAFT_440474 [Plicaturopsis crispa FD-325 SS-3]
MSHRALGAQLTRKRQFFMLIGVTVLLLFAVSRHHVRKYRSKPGVPIWYSGGTRADPPPQYERLRAWEDALPQHDVDLPFPEGKDGRYVKFSSQVYALGWNNVLNEILLCTHLAYESKRAYVFQDYHWKPEYYPWPIPVMLGESSPESPRTPLNALIAGPTAGGPWDADDDAPRSVSAAWFDHVCPRAARRIITTDSVKPALRDAQGDVIHAHWTKLLRDAPERCVEVVPGPSKDDDYPQVFDLWTISSLRILPLWDAFSKSPTSRLLATSPLVRSAVDRNEYLFHPRGPRPAFPAPHDPFARMMALHIRRGDFDEACLRLARWNSTFYGWNLLPALPDHFEPPPGGAWGLNTPANVALYMEHCWPTSDAIIVKVREVRASYVAAGKDRLLDVMYLLTNGEQEWLELLKYALRREGWHNIVTSKDLQLDREQFGVNMAVDMDIARQAAVFIGNGVDAFLTSCAPKTHVSSSGPRSRAISCIDV